MRTTATMACAALALAVGAALGQPGDGSRTLHPDDFQGLTWRSIGPANMGGRVASIALAPGAPRTVYLGYATGGVWKTTNNGTTWSPIFDRYETGAVGSVAVCDAPPDWPGWAAEDCDPDDGAAPDPDRGKGKIVWVGTGEGNGRNSSSWGHGVYRSTDGGASFEHVGLADSHDIPALAVDPRNPDVCFVAALGHLWGPNAERGVYRTTDGGKTWRGVLKIDEDTGACDVILGPADGDLHAGGSVLPTTVYAAMYMRRRSPGSFRSGGPEGGIYRSRDGGETWVKLTEGLPGQTGRIGLDVCRTKPNIVMAVIESDEGGWIADPFTDRQRGGGVFRSEDGGDTWTRLSDYNPRAFYFSRIRIDPEDDRRVYLLGWRLYVSDDGGRNFLAIANVPHVDFHAMVVDPDDTDHLLVGNDGGLYVSWDRGKTWDFHNTMAVGQFYNVAVDRSDPYRVGGGLQDNGTWIGPSETMAEERDTFMGRDGAITNGDWQFIWGGDGFHVAFDPVHPEIVYAESQGGYIGRVNLATGEQRLLRPSPKEGEPRFRFNWNAPFFVSAHDPATLYLGGNHVFKLADRGERWTMISDDLSGRDLGDILAVGSDAETAGTIVSLAESPVAPGMLWAGTDDGFVHVTLNDGGAWRDVTPPQARGLYVSKIEPSHHDRDTAYVAVDGHRSDVFEPILLATTDAGSGWTSIGAGLPAGAPPKVVREDPVNPDVLYAGTERACHVSIDRGASWVRLNGKTLPTVALDDLAIQPDRHDLVAGTHGRSIWILDDVTPIAQLTPEVVDSAFHAFAPRPARPRYRLGYGGLWSDRMFIAPNPPMGAVISYWIRDDVDEDVKVTVSSPAGMALRTLTGPSRRGINRVVWDLQPDAKHRLGNPHGLPEFVPPGTYEVSLQAGELDATTTVEVLEP